MQTLGQRLVDSGDDIGLHLKRYFSKHELVDGRLEHGPDGTYVYTSNKPVILVLGFGCRAAFCRVANASSLTL